MQFVTQTSTAAGDGWDLLDLCPLPLPSPAPPPQEVLSVPGCDCLFMGPVDLSHALGLAQRLGFPGCLDSEEFQARGLGPRKEGFAGLAMQAARACPAARAAKRDG